MKTGVKVPSCSMQSPNQDPDPNPVFSVALIQGLSNGLHVSLQSRREIAFQDVDLAGSPGQGLP